MTGTAKQTRTLAKFAVYQSASDDEIEVLDIADQFREQLCALMQERHERMIELRNRLFPTLFAALVRHEWIKARIYDVEKAIKAHHSDVRDRNAVTAEQEAESELLREQRAAAIIVVKAERAKWSALLMTFGCYWSRLADWKKVKALEVRKSLYAALVWPSDLEPYRAVLAARKKTIALDVISDHVPADHLAEYATLWMEFDLRERDLSAAFAPKLHPAIRAEIIEASHPKMSSTSPGMRYECGRRLKIRPWTKLTIKFGGGGLPVLDAIEGTQSFSLRPLYTNHTSNADETVYAVTQQIGTKANPRLVTYHAKLHRSLPGDATIQRWTLRVRDDGKRYCAPIISGCDFNKPIGKGTFTYDLSWTRKKNGIQVARFYGENINETLVIPTWLVEKRMSLKSEQAACDVLANEFLTRQGMTPQVDEKQGIDALVEYAATTQDHGAANLLNSLNVRLKRALKASQSAARCIEDIYKVVTSRVCRLHDAIVENDIILTKIKRYDTRDLLRDDVLGSKSREIMFAVAPGKLKALLNGYGLTASNDVAEALLDETHETDVAVSYVRNLGTKTGRKANVERRCSRHATQPVKVQ